MENTDLKTTETNEKDHLDVKQRFLRRLWLLDNIAILLREAQYHKLHQAAESRPAIILWRASDPEGYATISENNNH